MTETIPPCLTAVQAELNTFDPITASAKGVAFNRVSTIQAALVCQRYSFVMCGSDDDRLERLEEQVLNIRVRRGTYPTYLLPTSGAFMMEERSCERMISRVYEGRDDSVVPDI